MPQPSTNIAHKYKCIGVLSFMRRKNKFYRFILIIIVSSVLFSCASKPNVFGRWLSVENKGTIEFKEDGTFVGVDNMGATFIGNYIINNGKIKLEITHTNIMRETIQPEISPEVVNAKISISADELQFMFNSDEEDGVEIERYRREKSYR
jgi:hypothetical protein